MTATVIQGDCIEVLKGFDDSTFDSIVTDPPYALSFMGKDWDSFGKGGYQAWCESWACECLRVLKPGGYLLAFGGTRTYHRLACAIEDAGFEIRDSLHWIYGSGFPKSRDISKAIDSEAGAEREVIGKSKRHVSGRPEQRTEGLTGSATFAETIGMGMYETAPATAAAKAWAGWGTALKPAHEPIVMARKPLVKGCTVAANALEFGTGGINVNGCRVGLNGESVTPNTRDTSSANEGWVRPWMADKEKDAKRQELAYTRMQESGRWPPNVLLTHSPGCEPTGVTRVIESSQPAVFHKAAAENDGNTSAAYGKESRKEGHITPGYGTEILQVWDCAEDCPACQSEIGSAKGHECFASCPVAEMDWQSGTLKTAAWNGNRNKPKTQDVFGEFELSNESSRPGDSGGASRFFPVFRYCAKARKKERPVVDGLPGHPTVKPIALMQWLVRLVTPPGGYVLDPFAGTGTTAEACELEGFDCLLIERDADSIKRIEKRMSKYQTEVE